MAEYARRSRTIRRVEYAIPTPWPTGATWEEVAKAVAGLTQELGPRWTSDDKVRVKPGDDEVIVYFDEEVSEDVAPDQARVVTGDFD